MLRIGVRRPFQPGRDAGRSSVRHDRHPRHALYIAAQVVGGLPRRDLGQLDVRVAAVELSTTERSSGALWLSEVVATVGLLLIIHGCVRTGRANVVAFAVGIWIGRRLLVHILDELCQPGRHDCRTLSDSFAGIEPASAPMFIVMQLAGGVLAFFLIRFLYPQPQ